MNCSTQASLPITSSRSLLKLMCIESVMSSSHLILCHPLLLLPPIPPSIRVFSNESALQIRWPKYWSFSFSISPSNEHPGLISFRRDWLDLLAVQGTRKSPLQHHSSKASILRCSAFFMVQLSHLSMTTGTPLLEPLNPHRFHSGKCCRQGSLPPLPVGSICCWIASTASPPFAFHAFIQPAETFVIRIVSSHIWGIFPALASLSLPVSGCSPLPGLGQAGWGLSPLACCGSLSRPSGDPTPLQRCKMALSFHPAVPILSLKDPEEAWYEAFLQLEPSGLLSTPPRTSPCSSWTSAGS